MFVANWLAQEPLFDWRLVSADGKPVRASNGRTIPVDGDLAAAGGCKTVFVLASFDARDAPCEPRVLRWLRRAALFGVELGGIESGSLVLAEAGLLNGLKVAVHWDNLIGFQERYPKTRAVAQLYARSGKRITCAGGSAVLDMMVAWMGWCGESQLAGEVADHLLLGGIRPADTEQRMASVLAPSGGDYVVEKARTLMREHVEEPLTCRELARRTGLSLRQIERRFRQELGCSLLQQYRLIRMSKAHQLLQQTELPVTQVAFACGFSSPEYFCRLYRAMFDCSPSTDRRQSTDAPVLRQPLAGASRLPRRRAGMSRRKT